MFKSARVEHVPARTWKAWIDEHDGVVLDVREPSEWATGTLPNAEMMSVSEFSHRWRSLDPATPTLVVCRTGRRSKAVAKALHQAGFSKVANLSGGLVALGMAA